MSPAAYNEADSLKDLGFQILSPSTSIYSPSTVDLHTSSDDPTIIVFCSWAFALPKHIAKYLVVHQKIYPQTTILLLQNEISNIIWRPDSWQRSFFDAAALAIRAHLAETSNPRILAHIFSNGGSHGIVQLAETYCLKYDGEKIPIDAMVLDSCPGKPDITVSAKVLSMGAPSNIPGLPLLARTAAYIMLGTTKLLDSTGFYETGTAKLWRVLNEPDSVFLIRREEDGKPEAVHRVYIYSETDQMINHQDVEDHADQAVANLNEQGVILVEDEEVRVVRSERFEGTSHVNHIRGRENGERYWRIVQEVWSERRLTAKTTSCRPRG